MNAVIPFDSSFEQILPWNSFGNRQAEQAKSFGDGLYHIYQPQKWWCRWWWILKCFTTAISGTFWYRSDVAASWTHGLRASGITLPSLSTLRDFANLSLVDGLAFFQARSLGPEWSKLESREGYVKAIEDLKISKEHRIEWNMYTMYHFNSFQV